MPRDKFHDVAQLIIAICLITGVFIFLYSLYFGGHQIDPGLKESLVQIVGAISAIVGTIVGFYFGTSLSSVRKDAVISQTALGDVPATTTTVTTEGVVK